MKRFASVLSLALLFLSACAQPPTPIAFQGQEKERFTRCTLRPNRQVLFSSNYLGFPPMIPAGSPSKVNMFSASRVDLTLNKISYQMFPRTVPFDHNPDLFLKKYFVDRKEELGLEGVDETMRKNIQNGVWVLGMTKAEVYAALGPPNWIDHEIEATNLPLETILERNRWEYRHGDIMFPIFPEMKIFVFEEGKLRQTIP